jgi:tetratricopeptide (TPR) repeat protein
MRHRNLITLCVLAIFLLAGSYLFAQAEDTSAAEAGAAGEKPAQGKVDPVFPNENTNLIFIEGEHAVATNFDKQAIKNFGCSGKQTLQLNRATGLQGGAAFYADFLFYVEDPGSFELWYGGTPAGPQGEDLESYSSPFTYIIDDTIKVDVYRRRMVVVEQYTPSYYWNLVGDVNLSKGRHKIRFQVSERRRYDGRYYFYLDCFFLVRKSGRSRIVGTPVPEVFPKNMDDRSINKPFLAIEEYLKRINQRPNDIRPYIEVSMIYSLLSDYLSALKYLKRAQALDRNNQEVLLLLAKNTIWDGNVEEGLNYYRELLSLNPKRYEVWLEAGKVAAWTGRYHDAIEFFKKGLEQYPDDLGLRLNWGITLEWSGEVREAEGIYNQVLDQVKGNRLLLKKLADEYNVNGYPLRAAAVYTTLQNEFPQYLEYYIDQQEIYNNNGKQDEAAEVEKKIKERFNDSKKLDAYLALQKEKQGLREALLADYRKELERNPDNLDLRELLAQTLFWNGLVRQAVNEYLNILTNHTYREIKLSDSRAFSLLESLDKLYILYTYFNNIPHVAADKKKEVDDQLVVLKRTGAEYDAVGKQIQSTQQDIEGLSSTLTGEEASDAKVNEAIAKARDSLKELEKQRDALSKQMVDDEKAVGDKIKEGYAYFERYKEAVSELEGLITSAGAIAQTEAKEEDTFEKVKETTTWKWDKALVMGELRQLEAQKMFLAEFIIAKIAQAEKRYGDAENQIKDDIENTPTLPPESKYLYLETLIWQGKGKAALGFMDKELGSISEYAPYAGDVRSFLVKYAAVSQYMGKISSDYQQELQNLAAKFDGIISEAQGNKDRTADTIDQLMGLYEQRLVRTFFYNQQNTYLLRNELGKFYLQDQNLNAAISQFRQVLAMDPNDMGAMYQLGLVYRWKGDWSAAMEQFKRVYDIDPLYERTMAFYNDLARQHCDLVQVAFKYVVETATNVEMSGSASSRENTLEYTHPFNTTFALRAAYDLEYFSYYKVWDPAGQPYTYHYHDLLLGLSYYNVDWGLRITPFVGVKLFLKDAFYTTMLANGFKTEPAAAIFDYYDVPEPYVYAEAGLWENGMFSALLRGGYERYQETYAYFLTNVYDIWGECNLILKLAFLDLPVIKGTKLRAYGKVDSLDDGNLIYETAGYLDITFLDLDYPVDLDVTAYGQVWYQDSTNDEPVVSGGYFKPQNQYQFFGGLGVSAYFPVAEGNVFGVSLKVQGGPYSEYQSWVDKQVDFIKIEGDLTLEYAINALRFYLETNYQGTYNEGGLLQGDQLSYGQLTFRLGLEGRFPGLLTQ